MADHADPGLTPRATAATKTRRGEGGRNGESK